MNNNISVIIPAFNEEEYIEQTLLAIFNWSIDTEIIVVDDGSIDGTKGIIKKLANKQPILAVFLDKNVGKGKALMKGIERANGDVLLFLDADLGESAIHAERLIPPVINEDVDMTIAILPKPSKKGGVGLVKKLAKKGIFIMTGYNPIAPLSGQRALKRQVIQKIPYLVNGFGIEVGLTIDTLKNGFSIKEIELPLSHRETGRDLKGFLHRGKEFIAVGRALLYTFKRYRKSF